MADAQADAETVALFGPARLAYFTPVREYPPLGDRKASILLAEDGLLATVLLFYYQEIEDVLHGPILLEYYLVATATSLMLVLMLVGGWCAFEALAKPIPPMPTSLAYFRDIAALPSADYSRAMLGLTHARAIREILHYNHAVATLSVAKFRLVLRAVACLRAAFIVWVALMLLIALSGR